MQRVRGGQQSLSQATGCDTVKSKKASQTCCSSCCTLAPGIGRPQFSSPLLKLYKKGIIDADPRERDLTTISKTFIITR